jgi:hypothetical protein
MKVHDKTQGDLNCLKETNSRISCPTIKERLLLKHGEYLEKN